MSPTPINADLRRRLADFHPRDETEARAVAAVRDLLAFPSAFSSGWFDPGHVTASAFVLHPHRPAVALILHTKLQRWLQPGGHVEAGDGSIVAAALREVNEEIGVGMGDEPWLCDVDIHTFPARPNVPEHLHHDVRIAFTADSTQLAVGDGVDDARWWPLVEVSDWEESLARPARKLVERIRLRN